MKTKVTITEIAEKAGVSTATVSRILNQKGLVKPSTQKKVLQAMEELQYDTALLSASVSCRLILVFIPDFANPFYAKIIDGIQQAAHENNFEIFLVQVKEIYSNYTYFSNLVSNGNFSGVIWLCTVPPIELLTTIDRICPTVMCCEFPENYDTTYVSIDDVSAAYKEVRETRPPPPAIESINPARANKSVKTRILKNPYWITESQLLQGNQECIHFALELSLMQEDYSLLPRFQASFVSRHSLSSAHTLVRFGCFLIHY